jgi:hypothetical protein
MIFFASKKKSLYFQFYVTKLKNFVVFAFTYVAESSALLNDDFCMTSHNVDSNEATKRGDEALNASSLQVLRSI